MMKLSELKSGMLVVGKPGSCYEGLAGEIKELHFNKTSCEIVTDFLETDDMGYTHRKLKSRELDNLILRGNEFIYFPYGWMQKGYDDKGNEYNFKDIVCKHSTYMNKVEDQWLPF